MRAVSSPFYRTRLLLVCEAAFATNPHALKKAAIAFYRQAILLLGKERIGTHLVRSFGESKEFGRRVFFLEVASSVKMRQFEKLVLPGMMRLANDPLVEVQYALIRAIGRVGANVSEVGRKTLMVILSDVAAVDEHAKALHRVHGPRSILSPFSKIGVF